jgi:hypothetical protein
MTRSGITHGIVSDEKFQVLDWSQLRVLEYRGILRVTDQMVAG